MIMNRIFGWMLLAVLAMSMSGCANDMSSVNALIAQTNVQRQVAYGAAMKACGENAACQVGVSMSFAGNMGQQQFFKPETAKDYLEAGLPYVGIVSQMYMVGKGKSGGSNTGGTTVVGDHNVMMDMNNEKHATDNSQIADSNSGSSERLIDMLNRTYSMGTPAGDTSMTDGGLAYEPTDVVAVPTTSGLPVEVTND